ncbi:MAG: hypothetical protein GVY16_11545 [Planctomycetes bacterium]|jgi:hypothetical protein|nr:hypothetical protein [Phycisphaerae bacterium]NBB96357.1 hypothetical protein [Planctomycetota bacterium]
MDAHAKLRELLDLAESLGLEVRRVSGVSRSEDRPGGALVRVRGREVLFLDPTAPTGEQLAVVIDALRGRSELAEQWLPPAIRDLLDNAPPA